MTASSIYEQDLAWVHHVGFGDFSRNAGKEILSLLHRQGIAQGTLVDLGCGSGIWAACAQQSGFDVVGIDASSAMLNLARRESPHSKFIHASLHECPLPRCSVVTMLGEALNYSAGKGKMNVQKLFKRVADALQPQGMFIFDVIIAEGNPMNYRTWRSDQDWAVMVETKEDGKRQLLTRQIVTFRRTGKLFRRSEEHHLVYPFKRSDIEKALSAAGFKFRISRRIGKVTLAPRRIAFLARKTAMA